ncbi:hypothetical protein PTH_2105 [Pelotomaculum thermopropionicum SI]|uniref:Uncharacterized protein n=1 Tax=Pelotomaculum thermopropionicum (strain DSM 13744 / JCM 10971 / SI) TaxID=370438 RepID=A5D0D5_PELTS|nr:hypothetical protein PTH_2105 [Pelotomaculum thermopropionicum SI]
MICSSKSLLFRAALFILPLKDVTENRPLSRDSKPGLQLGAGKIIYFQPAQKGQTGLGAAVAAGGTL